MELAFTLADDAATVVLYGAFPKSLEVPIAPDAVHHHEYSIVGVYSQEPQDWTTSAGSSGRERSRPTSTRWSLARFDLADVSKAFELATTAPVYRVLVGR